jgi:hypothetical protein
MLLSLSHSRNCTCIYYWLYTAYTGICPVGATQILRLSCSKVIEVSFWRMNCLTSWGPLVPEFQRSPLLQTCVVCQIFKQVSALILGLSDQKFMRHIFHFKWHSRQSDHEMMYLRRSVYPQNDFFTCMTVSGCLISERPVAQRTFYQMRVTSAKSGRYAPSQFVTLWPYLNDTYLVHVLLVGYKSRLQCSLFCLMQIYTSSVSLFGNHQL